MRLERSVCRVCDAMVLVLVCLGFLLSSSAGHANPVPPASCTACESNGQLCSGTLVLCMKGGVRNQMCSPAQKPVPGYCSCTGTGGHVRLSMVSESIAQRDPTLFANRKRYFPISPNQTRFRLVVEPRRGSYDASVHPGGVTLAFSLRGHRRRQSHREVL